MGFGKIIIGLVLILVGAYAMYLLLFSIIEDSILGSLGLSTTPTWIASIILIILGIFLMRSRSTRR